VNCNCKELDGKIVRMCPLHKRAMSERVIDDFPDFVKLATTDIIQRFLEKGSEGVRAALYSWLPAYAKFYEEHQKTK
jgi:hypothetical protein